MFAIFLAGVSYLIGVATLELGERVADWFNADWITFPFWLASFVLKLLAFILFFAAFVNGNYT